MLREAQKQAEELQTRTEASAAERVGEVELLVANAETRRRGPSATASWPRRRPRADAVVAKAKDEGRALLEQVQEARRRVLADLAARRRQMGVQIEQLRAARDEMAASVHGVRDKVDAILVQLQRTDDEARAAALAVGDQARLHGGPGTRPTTRTRRTGRGAVSRAPERHVGLAATGEGRAERGATGARRVVRAHEPPVGRRALRPHSRPGTRFETPGEPADRRGRGGKRAAATRAGGRRTGAAGEDGRGRAEDDGEPSGPDARSGRPS